MHIWMEAFSSRGEGGGHVAESVRAENAQTLADADSHVGFYAVLN